MISVIMTVYNNSRTISECLDSIIKAMEGLRYEVVIVDNYSEDGTFEVLMEYAKHHKNIRIFRYWCSRGLGKNLAFHLSKGDYVIPIVDPDSVIEEPEKFRLIIDCYLKSRFKDKKAMGIPPFLGIFPRNIMEKVCWRDLNRAEDNEFLARVHKENMMVLLPLRVKTRHEEVCGRPISILPTDWYREKRYAKSLKYFSRFIRNKIDMVTGAAWTVQKVIREYRYAYGRSMAVVFLSSLYHFFFILLRKLMGRKVYEADPYLSNYLYVTYSSVKVLVNPFDCGFQKKDLNIPSLNDPVIRYIARFYPDIIDAIRSFHLNIQSSSFDDKDKER